MKYILLIFSLLLIPSFAGITYGHTVDAVGEYRVEIGWMNEPVAVSYTHLRAHETDSYLVCRLLLEKRVAQQGWVVVGGLRRGRGAARGRAGRASDGRTTTQAAFF